MNRASSIALNLLLMTAIGGCAFGPKLLETSHGPFAAAVQLVDEEQLLRSIVRFRYMESPQSLDVTAIAAQYELGISAEARPFFSTEATGNAFRSFSTILPFLGASGAERPTISFSPSDDSSEVRQFLTPISTDTLVFLCQTGWPAANVLRIWVDRLNGVPNWVPPSGPQRDKSPDFQRFRRACDLLELAQDNEWASLHVETETVPMSTALPKESVDGSDAVEAAKQGFEYRQDPNGGAWFLQKKEARLVLAMHPSTRFRPELQELEQILNLAPGREKYPIFAENGVSDPVRVASPPATEIRFAPRSSAQAFFFLSNGVDVPLEHQSQGIVPSTAGLDQTIATQGIFHVHSCAGKRNKRPSCAYTSIWYRGHWFYIDDRDIDSKATLFLMLQLRRLDFQRQRVGGIPALTLAVGR